MDELYRFDILGLSPIDLAELTAELPEGSVQEKVTLLGKDEVGILDPLSATVIVTLGYAAITGVAAWILKNRSSQKVVIETVGADGERQRLCYTANASTSEADVIDALSKLMSKAHNLPKAPRDEVNRTEPER